MHASPTTKKVMVAMSGGVDSSVAAFLLKEQGYTLAGVTMCFGIPDVPNNPHAKCCGATAIEDARKVCLQLDIPHYVLDFSQDLEKYVIADFVSEYAKGRTPNPCARCNEYLKFGKLLAYAKSLGFSHIATGHYAKIVDDKNGRWLARPKDKAKDQTYFLAGISPPTLAHILFPLENLDKSEVRALARKIGLLVAEKPQSQDICFVPGNDYRELLTQKGVAPAEGEIVDMRGTVLGKHQGITNYTLGQRGGLGVAVGRPQYIVSINPDKNQIVVGDKKDICSSHLKAIKLTIHQEELPLRVMAQIRYQHKEVPCQLTIHDDQSCDVVFDQAQESVTPGQSIVFYINDVVVASAIIDLKID